MIRFSLSNTSSMAVRSGLPLRACSWSRSTTFSSLYSGLSPPNLTQPPGLEPLENSRSCRSRKMLNCIASHGSNRQRFLLDTLIGRGQFRLSDAGAGFGPRRKSIRLAYCSKVGGKMVQAILKQPGCRKRSRHYQGPVSAEPPSPLQASSASAAAIALLTSVPDSPRSNNTTPPNIFASAQ